MALVLFNPTGGTSMSHNRTIHNLGSALRPLELTYFMQLGRSVYTRPLFLSQIFSILLFYGTAFVMINYVDNDVTRLWGLFLAGISCPIVAFLACIYFTSPLGALKVFMTTTTCFWISFMIVCVLARIF